MSNLRQTILIRTDLTFPTGLLAAQVGHLHMEALRQYILSDKDIKNIGPDSKEWLKDPYIFVHGVPNREVLHYFMDLAKQDKMIPVSVWSDTVYVDISPTQRKAFSDVLVGATFGPCDSDKIKAIIGDLPLL